MSKLEKLHLICSSDDLRPAMCNVKIEGRYAIATDGHVLVKIKVSNIINLEVLDGYQIPKETWQELCRATLIDCRKEKDKVIITFIVNGQQYEYFVKESQDKYPDIKGLMDYYTTENIKPITTISFNPSLIDRIKKATGLEYHSHMNVLFFGKRRGFLITSEFVEGFALVMPVMASDISDESIITEIQEHI